MFAVVFAVVGTFKYGQAQSSPQLLEAPPHIEFRDWKEVPSEAENSEFTASFPSPVVSPYRENNEVPIRVLLPAEHSKPLPAVLILHYWGATDLRVERELALELNDRGIGAVLVTLPYHLARTPAGFRSGQLAIQPDPKLLVETTLQAVSDVRRTIDFIFSRPEFDHNRIGIAGTSLGSIVSVLSYAVDRRLTTACFLLGGIDLAHILWHSSRAVEVREGLRRKGVTESKLRDALATIEPTSYLANRPAGKVLIIGGKYDTVIPPIDTQKLIDASPGAKVLWLDTGHYGGIFVEKRVLRTVADFFGKDFGGQGFEPPLRIYAPTIRIGALANTADGLQVGAGLDLFHGGPHGDFFSTLIITPKGPELFLGAKVAHGFAIGGFGTQRRASVGVWWSTVL